MADIIADPDAKLTDLDGIGKDLAKKIEVIVQTGTLPQLDELKEQIPSGVLDMLRIPGIGPKKVGAMFEILGIDSLEALKAAAEAGQIAELKGFGKKTEQLILDNIERRGDCGCSRASGRSEEGCGSHRGRLAGGRGR